MDNTENNKARKYFQKYIDLCEEEGVVEELEKSLDSAVELLKTLTNAECETAYESGKWTIKEVLGHVIDTERVFQYRALRFSRNDQTKPLQFDQDSYIEESFNNDRPLIDIVFEFMTVRNASISLFKGLNNIGKDRTGSWSDSEFSVREIAKLMSGHGRHHLTVIKEKYLKH